MIWLSREVMKLGYVSGKALFWVRDGQYKTQKKIHNSCSSLSSQHLGQSLTQTRSTKLVANIMPILAQSPPRPGKQNMWWPPWKVALDQHFVCSVWTAMVGRQGVSSIMFCNRNNWTTHMLLLLSTTVRRELRGTSGNRKTLSTSWNTQCEGSASTTGSSSGLWV